MAMQHVDELFETARKMPAGERAELAGRLIETLDEEVDADAEQLWSIEIARRVRELDEGTARTVPWSEVQRQLREPRTR
jgi:putative addiction module component (TIGR02574 family)